MLIPSAKLLEKARKNGFALPHFNFWNSDSIRAEISAAESKQLPVILAWAQSHSDEISIEDALMLGKYYGQKAKIPVILHLDHGQDPDLVKWAAANGFTSVMIDGSSESFIENVKMTRDIVEYAHRLGVSVEAEIGHVGTNDSEDSSSYTEVDAAVSFAKETKVDSLAVSIGTSHGVYQQGAPKLNFERLAALRDAVKIPLVLHGGSSSGDENLTKAAQTGIAKVNIFTDLANAALNTDKKEDFSTITDRSLAERKNMQVMAEHYYDVFCTQKYHY